MMQSWTFGRKLALGFAISLAFTVLVSVVAVYALRSVVAGKDLVIDVNARNLVDAERLHVAIARMAAGTRAFLLTREERFVETVQTSRAEFSSVLDRLRKQIHTAEGDRFLADLERKERDYVTVLDAQIAQRRTNPNLTLAAITRGFDEQMKPRHDAATEAVKALIDGETRLLEAGRRASTEAASFAMTMVIGIAIVAVVLAGAFAALLSRTLSRQVGSAVQHIQSSSAELQAASNQQASATREQASAMTEITTTIKELLSTSRQIAEGAQRVTRIAESTAAAARNGDGVVQRAQDAISNTQRQIELVVEHMLALGSRSQQIGGVLEIVSELLEQTNILAINATIEASGAGESGKRFAAVADEIRKLSDRVAVSAKEVRTLVEEVRASVHATIMATEGGAKAVEAGMRQFGEVTASFGQIASQVGTTTEAAREIELSTKQQTTAVEQVNVAIADVSQSAKETEASATQTLQTASALAVLSRDLTRLIRPQVASAGA